jgi:PhnB protein
LKQLNPYLHFSGNCREAMEFYRDALGVKLDLQTVGESPMAAQMPDAKDNVMHATLKKGDTIILMASDMMEGSAKSGNTVSLSVDTESEEETKKIFDKLAAGGKVGQELKEQFWGGIYGDLEDKFGINWMFNFQKKPYNPKA